MTLWRPNDPLSLFPSLDNRCEPGVQSRHPAGQGQLATQVEQEASMTEGRYYKHSGKSSILGPPAGLILGILAGVPLAFIYAYLMFYMGFIPYIRLLTLFGPAVFGFILGAITGVVLQRRKVRNVAVTKVVSTMVGLASLYASWVFWIYASFHHAGVKIPFLPLILDPHLLWIAIRKINQVGTWGYGSLVPTGIVLWAWWGIEALMMVGAAMVAGAIMLSGEVFCEMCEEWCKKAEGACTVKSADRAEMKQRMEAKDFGYLEKLGAAEPGATAWVTLDILTCPTCRATNTLSASSKKVSVDKEGKKTVLSSTLIDNLLISSSEADTIRQIGQKLAASSAS